MALCYLTTLYCALRAWAHPDGWSWQLAAVAACAAGMASKESMVTAPLMVLVYDRVFLYPSLGAAFRERRALYIGLAATWVVLAVLMLGEPRTSVGFDAGVSPWTYFLNQLPIIAPLPVAGGVAAPAGRRLRPAAARSAAADVIVPGLLVLALGVATLLALRRHRRLGFLGVWFFVTLAPTSSIVPIATEVGAERRMYLPLMALAVLGGAWACTVCSSVEAHLQVRLLALPGRGAGGGVPAAGGGHHRPHARVSERALDRADQRGPLSARPRAPGARERARGRQRALGGARAAPGSGEGLPAGASRAGHRDGHVGPAGRRGDGSAASSSACCPTTPKCRPRAT